jgi:hypothetical protein
MKGTIGLYEKPGKPKEVRIHFPLWELPDGMVVRNVTVFPHPCDTCIGGDHTHVEYNDTRTPLKILAHECVELTAEERFAISELLRTKLRVDRMTLSLHAHIAQYAPVGRREGLFTSNIGR